MKNILVTVDFDEHTDLLIDKALEFTKPFKAKIWLLHVAAPEPDFVGYDVGPQYIRDYRAEDLRKEHKLIQEKTNALKEKGVNAEGLLIQGATIEMIIEESKVLKADLIVVGHNEHSLIHKIFFNHTSSQIIKKSKIPVLIVPLG